MQLLLVRHGRPSRHESTEGADPPLTAEGRAQAEALAAHFAPGDVDALYSSTMRRAVETAEPLAAALGLVLHADEQLCEFDRGSPAYVPNEDYDGDRLRQWQDLQAGRWGGQVFDLRAFRELIAGALEELIDRHPRQRVVVVCHGGVINAYLSHVLGTREPFFFQPAYTSVSSVLAARGGHREVQSINDSCHLLPATASLTPRVRVQS